MRKVAEWRKPCVGLGIARRATQDVRQPRHHRHSQQEGCKVLEASMGGCNMWLEGRGQQTTNDNKEKFFEDYNVGMRVHNPKHSLMQTQICGCCTQVTAKRTTKFLIKKQQNGERGPRGVFTNMAKGACELCLTKKHAVDTVSKAATITDFTKKNTANCFTKCLFKKVVYYFDITIVCKELQKKKGVITNKPSLFM